ncbi:MAG: HugZ family pyridoxamine 5'-phosphate oxidase [Candidatus Xenobia bacterium]
MSQPKEHNRTNSNAELSPVLLAPALSHANQVRTLLARSDMGTLCTLALEPAGYPYGSLVNYAIESDGSALFLISDLAEHTANLKQDARSSLFVVEPEAELAKGRATLMGKTMRVESTPGVRETYLARVPKARYYVDFKDFHFWRLSVEAIRYIGGFGRMSWVETPAYGTARPDPIVPIAGGIMQHMNQDHAESMVLMCRHHGKLDDVQKAVMTEIDSVGFEMEVTTSAGPRLVRIGFPEPVTTSDQVRAAMVSLVREARKD